MQKQSAAIYHTHKIAGLQIVLDKGKYEQRILIQIRNKLINKFINLKKSQKYRTIY